MFFIVLLILFSLGFCKLTCLFVSLILKIFRFRERERERETERQDELSWILYDEMHILQRGYINDVGW